MVAKIIAILGWIVAIWCIIDILKKNCDFIKKLLLIILVLATNWIGVLLYYFWLRNVVK